MIHLNVFELDKIKTICETVGTEYFRLTQDDSSGIGSILTLTYETEIADYPATVSIEVSGVESW
jgi:NAD(P)H-nitrite reductase large subunit